MGKDNRALDRQWFQAWKERNNTCNHCGNQYLPCQLDLHHIDEKSKHLRLQKPFTRICDLGRRQMLLELDKCIVLCKNCHALHHYNKEANIEAPISEGPLENFFS